MKKQEENFRENPFSGLATQSQLSRAVHALWAAGAGGELEEQDLAVKRLKRHPLIRPTT